jgi:hypothetical protein
VQAVCKRDTQRLFVFDDEDVGVMTQAAPASDTTTKRAAEMGR